MVPDVQTGSDLHEALKEIPRLGIGGAPDFFEVLVRVEEASFVEDLYAFSEEFSNLLVIEVRMKLLCWHGSQGGCGVGAAAPMPKPRALVSLEIPTHFLQGRPHEGTVNLSEITLLKANRETRKRPISGHLQRSLGQGAGMPAA